MKLDYSEHAELQQRLNDAAAGLEAMTNDVALARAVREFDGDRRKRCLAVAAAPLVKAGASSSAADTEARASEHYQAAMQQLRKELVSAEQVMAKWEVLKIQWETARSLMSMSKATMQNI